MMEKNHQNQEKAANNELKITYNDEFNEDENNDFPIDINSDNELEPTSLRLRTFNKQYSQSKSVNNDDFDEFLIELQSDPDNDISSNLKQEKVNPFSTSTSFRLVVYLFSNCY